MSSWTGCTSTSDANAWNRCTNMSFETALDNRSAVNPARARSARLPSTQPGQGFDAPGVEQSHAVGDDEQHLAAGELGNRAAHRFKRQSEIVGDVLPRHR